MELLQKRCKQIAVGNKDRNAALCCGHLIRQQVGDMRQLQGQPVFKCKASDRCYTFPSIDDNEMTRSVDRDNWGK